MLHKSQYLEILDIIPNLCYAITMKLLEQFWDAASPIRRFVEQPYRYLTINGDVFDRPFMDRFHHRAEIKITAAAMAIVAVSIEKTVGLGALQMAEFFVGGLGGYANGRSMGQILDFLRAMKFDPAYVVDKKPQEGTATSPENMLKVHSERDIIIRVLPSSFQSAALGLAVSAGVLTGMKLAEVHESKEVASFLAGQMATFVAGYSLGFAWENVSRRLSSLVLMDRILSREYALLSSPPEKQEILVHKSAEQTEQYPVPAGT